MSAATARQLVEQPQISVRSLDEQLRLSLGPGPLLEAADRLSPLGVLDGQIAVECERLPVEARSHQREQDRRRADQRRYADSVPVGQRRQVGSRIGHARQTRLRQYARIGAAEYGSQQFRYLFRRRVLVQLGYPQAVYRLADACPTQETAGRAFVFDDEIVEPRHDGTVVFRQDVVDRPVADRGRQHVDRSVRHAFAVLSFSVFPGPSRPPVAPAHTDGRGSPFPAVPGPVLFSAGEKRTSFATERGRMRHDAFSP